MQEQKRTWSERDRQLRALCAKVAEWDEKLSERQGAAQSTLVMTGGKDVDSAEHRARLHLLVWVER